jgi:hypothetical protein
MRSSRQCFCSAWFLVLLIMFGVASPFAAISIASICFPYVSATQATTAYDGTSLPSLDYDSIPVLPVNGQDSRSPKIDGVFGDFASFLGAEVTGRLRGVRWSLWHRQHWWFNFDFESSVSKPVSQLTYRNDTYPGRTKRIEGIRRAGTLYYILSLEGCCLLGKRTMETHCIG